MSLKIYLSSHGNAELDHAWKYYFEFCDDIHITQEDILDIQCDSIVSPGNSFGFMDGGLDLAITHHFGWEIQRRLQHKIRELPTKELLVGQAISISTESEVVKKIICSPTMRIPTSRNIPDSVNAYLATKAALQLAISIPEIESIAFPGLCTGTGKMSPEKSARQMFAAYEEIVIKKKREFPTFMDAAKFHKYLTAGR